jgi:hypothetical protein
VLLWALGNGVLLPESRTTPREVTMNELLRPLVIALLVAINDRLHRRVVALPGASRVQAVARATPWRAFALGLVNASSSARWPCGFLAERAGVPADRPRGIVHSFFFPPWFSRLVLRLACAADIWLVSLFVAGCVGLGAFVVTLFQRNN